MTKRWPNTGLELRLASEERAAARQYILSKVQIDDKGCWLVSKQQYAVARYYSVKWRGKAFQAHRLSHAAFNGHIPAGSLVLHRCDYGLCVNPAHLYLGDHEQNMRDMVERGRAATGIKPGEQHPRAKLTKGDVRAIRSRRASGESQRALASAFGVTQSAISRICAANRWTSV